PWTLPCRRPDGTVPPVRGAEISSPDRTEIASDRVRRWAVSLRVLALLHAVAGCQVLVTFDPIPDDVPDDGEPGEADGDAEETEGDVRPDHLPDCGNDVLDPDEDCEGAETRACDTACDSLGTQRCAGCLWGACEPPPESCNGVDDDCNGETDEDFPCAIGAGVSCTRTCGSMGVGECTPSCQVPTPVNCPTARETCNGEDDDCNGETDEDFPCAVGARLPCVTDCGSDGYRVCSAECALPNGPCLVPDEICNGMDDDCDGVCDDGFACCANASVSCLASCGSTGAGWCTDRCAVPTGAACTPPAERCNGADDDCDGTCDNGFACCAGRPVTCTTGCGSPGTGACSASCEAPGPAECSPPGGETCDGVDNDCDGFTDEDAYVEIADDVRITTSPGASDRPVVAWSGAEYGVAWSDDREAGNREIYFARLDRSGRKIGGDVRATAAPGLSGHPSLVWAGSEWGVAWRDERDGNGEIYFGRIGADGVRVGEDVRLSDTPGLSTQPSLVWAEGEYAVAWRDEAAGAPVIRFTRIDAGGSEIPGAETRLTDAPGMDAGRGPSLAWTGAGFGLAWDDTSFGNPEIVLALLPPAGEPRGPVIRVTDDPRRSTGPSLVRTGAGFGVAWRDFRDGNFEVYFARLDSAGARLDADVRVTAEPDLSTTPSLAWTGSEFGLAWQDNRDGNAEMYFARLDPAGARIGGEMRITSASGESTAPDLRWSGDAYALVWHDLRSGDAEVYFSLIGCP
ncbi:MAG: MopE-related protein, partial [Myxococcota bacterium]|nr:MopE-related protein [Myxococcota bacterium]